MCNRWGRSHRRYLMTLALLAFAPPSHAQTSERSFDIPAAEASTGLSLFAKQANTPLLYLNDDVRRKQTNAVHGAHSIQEALDILLASTGIVGSINRSGVLTVTVAKSPTDSSISRSQQVIAPPPAPGELREHTVEEPSPEVIVTAQFHAESLQRTPLAITAISGAEMLDKGYNDITGLAQLVPSVDLTSTGAYGGKTLAAFIRGVGASDYNFGVEPGVAFYLDDVYLGPSYGTMLLLDVSDLERIEVLRGPQGTLSGKNAIGGAVRLVTQKPKGDGSGYVEVEGGSLSTLRFRAAYDMPVIDDQLFMRVSGYSSHRDGYVELLDFACVNPTETGNTAAPYGLKETQPPGECRRGNLGDEDVHAGKLQFRWLPTENVEVNLSGDYIDDDSNGAADVLIGMNPSGFTHFDATTAIPLYGVPYDTRFLPPNRYSSYATFSNPQYGLNYPSVDTLLTRQSALTADWKINSNMSLTSITGYREYTGHWSYDSDSSPLATDGVYDIQSHEQLTQEIRLTGTSLSDRLSWTFGGFYYHGRERDVATIYAALYNLFIDTDSRPSNTNYAAYLHTEYALTDALTLVAGLRQSYESKTYLYIENDIPGTPSNSFPGGFYDPAHTGYNHFDYRFGLQYQVTPDFMTYVDVATGFRGGGFNPRPATPAQAVGYGPERLISYEIGARNEFLDRRIQFNNTGYFSHYTDIQLTANLVDVGTGFPDAVVTNAATADIYGFESELRADFNSWLSLNGAASYTHFRYTNLGLAAGFVNGPTLESDQVYTPTWKFNMGAKAALPLLQRYGKLTLESDFSWRSLQYADAANSPQLAIPAYGLLDARLEMAMEHGWLVSLGGTNITDRFYYSAKNFISGNYQWKGVPGLPAQWYLSVRRSF